MSSRLKLFGCAIVETIDGPLGGRAAQRHRMALLAMLASTRRPSRSRDTLIAMLWPEADSERGRRLLSDSVYRINQALGAEVLVSSGDDLRLNGNILPSDVADFERAVLVGNHAIAAQLYVGPFLEGFHLPGSSEFDQWLEEERSRYAVEAIRTLEALAEESEQGAKWTDAAGWWRRAAAMAPDSSRIAIRLMQALDASGDRAAAIRHAMVHGTLVRETLGIEPDEGVECYAASLRGDPGHALAPQMGDDSPAVRASSGTGGSMEQSPSEEPAAAAGPTVPLRSSRWGWLAAAAIVSVAAAALTAILRTPDAGSAQVAADAIAVLPFRNLTPSETTGYFADGITEELMHMLGRDPDVRVLSRTSAFAYRDSLLDVRDIGRRLGVGWVVEGSVRRGGDALRITAQLTNTMDGYQVWSETFDRAPSDVFAIQEEIATAVASHLHSGAQTNAKVPQVAGATTDAEAYDLYLRGRYHWHRRTERDLREAAALLERSVARAPGYARGWAGLGDAYAVMGFYDHLPPAQAFPRAEDAARRALRLDDQLAAPYATIGYVNLYYHWNWSASESFFRRAIELEPTYSTAHQWLANLLTAMGRFDEAELEMTAAQQLDPLSLIANAALGWVYYYAGRQDDAVTQLQRTLALDGRFQLAHLWKGLAESERGRHVEAMRAMEEAARLSEGNALTDVSYAFAVARSGAKDSAQRVIGRLLEREQKGEYIPSYELAKAYLASADTSQALTRLERAFEERSHSMAFLKVDPPFTGLRQVSRYRALLGKVGLDEPAAARAPRP
jgi:TolB-like protein/DNA-binding SARP family transcriptional activator